MDYFIEFEDGSDGYLSHHGVLGMKWGVRNAETQARYAGDSGHARAKTKNASSKKLVKAAIIAGGALTIAAAASTPSGRAAMKKGASVVARTLKKRKASTSIGRSSYEAFKYDRFEPDVFRPDIIRSNR